jgi:hypothetical protein
MICRQKRLQRLQAAHPETLEWTADSLELKQAVAVLCTAKVAAFQLEVERMQRLHFTTKWMQQKIGDVARKEHQKLTRELQRLAGLLTQELQMLVAWEGQRQRYKQYLAVDATGELARWHLDLTFCYHANRFVSLARPVLQAATLLCKLC